MWNKPWKLKEGFLIGGGLVLIGLLLQWTVGAVDWDLFAFPVNLIVLCGYLLLIGMMFIFREKVYLFRWMGQYGAAVSSLVWVVLLTVIMGAVRQVPAHIPASDAVGITRMLTFWPFVLLYWWVTTIVGMVSLKRLISFRWQNIPFLLNHLGLFIALLGATLGNADMQRLTLTAQVGKPEWRASDKQGYIHELPLVIELREFVIDEYPPKLILIDNATGKVYPEGEVEDFLLEEGVDRGFLHEWNIQVNKRIAQAAAVIASDTVSYVDCYSTGATYAVHVEAVNKVKGIRREGWISCGSFLFPYQVLKLDSACSLAMPDREPERFASDVSVYTESGKELQGIIEVNKPLEVEGWRIYQLSYDKSRGKWSDISIFELVSDPWLPVVYTGIWMMFLGAICMFVMSGRKEDKT